LRLVDDLRRLSVRNRIVLSVVAVAVTFALIAMVRAANAPTMGLLYAGLDPSSSGDIIEKLDSMNIVSEVKGDAIYVPLNKRDAVRMTLASAGMPRQGQAGFELLDDLNAFAATPDMFDASYWRAKEGELARTISATPGVKSARVHIAVPKRRAFTHASPTPSAVVTIGMARGTLGASQAEAARFIVALAVPDLEPGRVAVIDSAGGVILAPVSADNRQALPGEIRDRELALENSLIDLLEARVGLGNARVKVAMEISNEQSTSFERTLDPQQRILTSRESSEMQESGADGGGAVTVASNLPEGDATAQTSPGQSRRNETSESAKFDVSEKRLETTTPAGAVKRIQVAVLINQPSAPDQQDGAQPARSEEELAALKSLVATAAGADPGRGDVVTIESMAFEQPAAQEGEAAANPVIDFLGANMMPILQLIIPGLVALLLALFVLKPILSSSPNAPVAPQATPPQPAPALAAPHGASAEKPAAPSVDDLRRIASERRSESTKVIENWLDEQEAAA